MPKPIDLTGRRFGKLVVLRAGEPQASTSGKTAYKTWECHCDCGRKETLPQKRLPYCPSNAKRKDSATACNQCRIQRTCSVCSKEFESTQYKKCCSDACQLIQRRANDLAHYYRRTAIDPDHNKKNNEKRKERAKRDPEYAARLATWEAKANERKAARRSDPQYREKENRQRQERHAKIAEQVYQRRRERLEKMTPEQYEDWASRRREYGRIYAATRRATPEGRERYQKTMREYMQQQALRKLFAVGDSLIQRSLNND